MYTKFDWMHEGKFTTIDVNWFNASSVPLLGILIREARKLYLETRKDVTWTGVASQYFCTIVTTQKTKGLSAWATRFDTRKLNDVPVYGIQGGLGMPAFTLAPGQSVEESFQIYAGPKDLSQLRKLGGGQEAVMNFGMFGFVSEFLLWAMNSLKCRFSQLRGGDNRAHHYYQVPALADSEQGDESTEKDVPADSENDRASREV